MVSSLGFGGMKCKLDGVKLRTHPAASDLKELQAGMLWALEPKVDVYWILEAFLELCVSSLRKGHANVHSWAGTCG